VFGHNRDNLRRFYYTVWRKQQHSEPLEPLEQLVAEVIAAHPEYHPVLMGEERHLERDYLPDLGDENPFLHMGMHIALKEQVATDRPAGLGTVYHRLVLAIGDPHAVEHRMMDCLGEVLWRAQQDGSAPDEIAYLECLERLNAR